MKSQSRVSYDEWRGHMVTDNSGSETIHYYCSFGVVRFGHGTDVYDWFITRETSESAPMSDCPLIFKIK